MKKLLGLVFGIILVAGSISPVYATPSVKCGTACTAIVSFEGVTFDLSRFVSVSETTGLGTLGTQTLTNQVTGSTAQVSATFNPDPSIIFGIAYTNNTTIPQAFTAVFTTPIALTGSIDAASSLSAYSFTDGFKVDGSGAAGVTLTPGPAQTKTLVGNDLIATGAPTNKGVSIGDARSGGVAPCGAFVGPSSSCDAFAATNTFSGGPFVAMVANVGFTLTAKDSVGFTGSLEQHQHVVPEPATVLLMATGLLGLAGWRRYSSRR
jgi:hypothetical protein